MTVGIDIRVLGNPVKSGIEEYVECLMPHLIKEGHNVNFKLFFSSRRNSLRDYEWLKEVNVKLYKFSYPNNFLFTSSRFLNRPFIDKMVEGADVFFFPHFFISSLSPRCKRVTTFHDLSYIHFPEFLTPGKKAWHNLQMKPEWQAKFSDKIIAVSESTKKDIVNFYKIDPAKTEVIYSGVLSHTGTTDTASFKKIKNLPSRFIFFLGKLEPRKNIPNIIKAFGNLKSNPKYNDVGLVIAGDRGWLCDDIFKEAKNSNYASQIIFTGHLNEKERQLYYKSSDIFIYPSFFEGFGFPPLEAMSCGTPVITSRNSSLPEIVGEAAITIDPYDVGELELWINKLLDDNELRNHLIKKGTERAAQFNWRNTALKTLEVLTKA